jgi:N-formylglutamate amidohydrolase
MDTFNLPRTPFSIFQPIGREIPVVVEIPHAGLGVDLDALATLTAPARAIGIDADLYVDELYQDAAACGASVLIAHLSRYVCDLNRSESDLDSRSVAGARGNNAPHGLIWRRTTDDQPAIAAPLSPQELERRMQTIYRPYHQAMADLVQGKLQRFGYVKVLCAHSMPSRGRPGHRDAGTDRCDIVPGSRGRTTAAQNMIELPELLAKKRCWTVAHDDPYRGGYTTGLYGRPEQRIHAVQVEIARRLYMDEITLVRRGDGFGQVREYCRELVTALGELSLPGIASQ